ncbi:MAG: alanine racemase [Muribaculaceae bacterium]|nr:alanine racemase [Muribaculaceae bacterium]
MNYKISSIAEILELPVPPYPDNGVEVLVTDSRSVADGEGVLFFALRTRTNDGHNFIVELYRRGVRNFVVDHIPDCCDSWQDVNFLVVGDVVGALQRIGAAHRMRFDIPVIAVTGSRGKTTVKEWLYQLLNSDRNVVRSPRSYNSQIGVPLSLWQLDQDADMAIFEAGISKAGEMSSLEAIISPTVGIMTNIGDEHGDGFASVEEKCREKIGLFRRCAHVVYNADDLLISRMMEEVGIPQSGRFGWSRRDSSAPLFVIGQRIEGGATVIDYRYEGTDGCVTIPFTSPHDVENALHCLSVLLLSGVTADVVAARMARLSAVDTRLNVMEGVNNCMLIHDGYTSDLYSLIPALDFMNRRMTSGRNSTVIISDVTHEQLDGDMLYRTVAGILESRKISRIIGIGPEMMRHALLFGSNARFFNSTAEFLAETSTGDFDSELILVKGAPQFCFDRISEMLEARHHETVLEVNLDSVVHNFNHFRSMLRPSTGIVVMVKASGYGAGSYELAKTLQAQGAAYLAVAVLDEGVELRRAGITMPIMVLNPKVINYNSMFAHALEPEIFTFEMLDDIIREAGKRGIEDYPVHIKFDTGMHRLGFLDSDIPELIRRLSAQRAVTVKSVFSHLATADCADMDDYTGMQLSLFDRCCEKLQAG